METTETTEKSYKVIKRVVLVILVLFVITIWCYFHFSKTQIANGQQVTDNLAVFDTRLENLEKAIPLHEKRISDLEQKVASFSRSLSTAPSAGNDDRITFLEKEVAALKVNTSNAANPSQDAPAANNQQISQTIHLLSMLHRLTDKVLAGRSFASELSAFEQNNPEMTNSPTIVALAPYSENGIPTLAQLLASFDDGLQNLGALEATPPIGASMWERFVFNLKHLINIRRMDESATDNSVDAILARAQNHLEKEEIEASISEIKSLPEASRAGFAKWLEDAQIYADAPTLIDQLEEQVMKKAFHASDPSPATAPAKGQ